MERLQKETYLKHCQIKPKVIDEIIDDLESERWSKKYSSLHPLMALWVRAMEDHFHHFNRKGIFKSRLADDERTYPEIRAKIEAGDESIRGAIFYPDEPINIETYEKFTLFTLTRVFKLFHKCYDQCPYKLHPIAVLMAKYLQIIKQALATKKLLSIYEKIKDIPMWLPEDLDTI